MSAQTSYYWSGDGSNNNWTTSSNFRNAATGTTNSTPLSSSQTQLIFGSRAATRTTANNTTAGFIVNGITFNSATDATNTSFTITGEQVDMRRRGSANPFITQNSEIGHSINVSMQLSNPLTLGGDGAGLITFGGTTAWAGGSQTITKNGTSAYLFNANASSAGRITVNGGTVALPTGTSTNLGNILLDGGVVAANGTFSRGLGTGASNIILNGANGGGFAAFGGALTVSTSLGTWGTTTNSLITGGRLILGSSIADNVVTLSSGLNLGTAVRTINLVENANSSADWSVISGVVSSGTGGGLSVTGSGRLVLSNANTYVGSTAVGNGVRLTLSNATGLGTTAAGTSVSSGGTLELDGGITVGAEALSLNGNGVGSAGALRNLSGNNTYGGLLTLAGASRVNSDAGTLTLSNAGTISGAGFGLTVGGAGNTTINSIIGTTSGTLSKEGAGTLTLTGANRFTGQLTVADGTLSIATINNASANGTLGNSANAVLLGSSGKTGTLEYTGTTASTTKPFSAAASGTAALNVTNAATTLTYSASLGGSGNIVLGGAGNHVIGGGIGGSVGSLTKNGEGALTLSSLGHSGGFVINQGRLNVNNNSAFGNSTSLNLASGVTLDNTSGTNVTVNSTGLVKTLGSSLNFIGTRDLSLGTGLTRLNGDTIFNITASTLTLAGNVTGNFGIIKNGTGSLVLSGLTGQSFVGDSVVNAGELFLDGTSVLSGTAQNTITLNAGGTLRIGASGGIGALTLVNKGGTLITNGMLNSNQVFAADVQLSSASTNFNGIQAISEGVTVTAESDYFGTTPDSPTEQRISMQNASTLRSTGAIEIHENKGIRLAGTTATFDTSSGTISIKSEISGSGRLIKEGNLDFRLVNTDNSYTGGTEIRGGTFGIYGDGSLGAAGTEVVIDGATLNTGQDTSGQIITIGSDRDIRIAKGKTNNLDASNGSTMVYNGGISEFGTTGGADIQINTAGSRAGNVVLGGVNTYTGATNINAGTLEVRGSGSINSSSAINVAAGATFIYNSSTTLDVAPTLAGSEGNKARFSGTATINAAMSLNHINDVLAPGNSPGIQNYTENQSWESFTYEWELRDWVNSELGVDMDFIQVEGSLELAGSAYQLEIVSLNALNAAGSIGEGGQGNQFAEGNRSWTVLTTTGGIQGFNAEDWMLDVTRFQDDFQGTWSLSQSGNSLVLNYITVPEPSAALLAGIGALLLLRRRR